MTTISKFVDIFIPRFIVNINKFIVKSRTFINNSNPEQVYLFDISKQNNIYNKEKSLYNTSNKNNLDNSNDLNSIKTIPLNDLVNDYKILTKRSLDSIYEDTFNDFYISPNDEVKGIFDEVKVFCKSGLYNWLKYTLYNHPEVITTLNPIVSKYVDYVNKQIQYLDEIPYIEQKTEEWFKIRKNMISASICGYIDSKECGIGLSKETDQILTKTNLTEKKKFYWGGPTKHGQVYEDLSGDFYDTFNGLTSKEYGILPDKYYKYIGASPDGIITNVNDITNFNSAKYMGRMREIKNPVSRRIYDKFPNYYYWQMQQQLYVCQLPMCDFIQTQFEYPEYCRYSIFEKDCLNIEKFKKCKTWNEISNMFADYILQNIYYPVFNELLEELDIYNLPIEEIEPLIVKTFIDNFDDISYIPLKNINSDGYVKGVLWCFIKKDDEGETDFKVEWAPISVPIENNDYLNNYYKEVARKHLSNGYVLDEHHYWRLEKYHITEIEYNQGLYEGQHHVNKEYIETDKHLQHSDNCIINRLIKKWEYVIKLRNIEDIEERRDEYHKIYPVKQKRKQKTQTTFTNSNSKYTKKHKSPKNDVEYDLT